MLGLDVGPPEHPRLVLGKAQQVGDMPREEAHDSMIANWAAGAPTYSFIAKASANKDTLKM
jgi:hypothetical protein